MAIMSENGFNPKRTGSILALDGQPSTQGPPIENTEVLPSEAVPEATSNDSVGPQAPKEPTASDIYREFFVLINEQSPLGRLSELRALINRLLETVMRSSKVAEKYNWLVIHDPLMMTRGDTDKIYKAITKFKEKREIGLIVTSGGGQIEPAYLISKLCRESTSGKFVTVVPRRAKSAATLICCGADEIHMGHMSELGPIDPQINDLPALGLKNAVQHLAELASQFPKAAEMFAKYLAASLDLVNLGYYERVAESAAQYADRLLRKRVLSLKGDTQEVAKHLVYGYKDHGFVIDRTEADSIFGDAMIKTGTPEYELGNAIYEWLAVVEKGCDNAGYSFYLYGAPESECNFIKKKK